MFEGYTNERFDNYTAIYKECLMESLTKNHDEYFQCPADEAGIKKYHAKLYARVIDTLLTKGIRGMNLNDSPATALVCRRLGIKRTYKAIEGYLKGD